MCIIPFLHPRWFISPSVGVASIVRIYYLNILITAINITYILGPAFGWSSSEPSVTIIGVCLPTYAPLFRGIRNNSTNCSTKDSHPLSQTPIFFLKWQSHFQIDKSDKVKLTNKKSFYQSAGESRDGEGSGGRGYGEGWERNYCYHASPGEA